MMSITMSAKEAKFSITSLEISLCTSFQKGQSHGCLKIENLVKISHQMQTKDFGQRPDQIKGSLGARRGLDTKMAHF